MKNKITLIILILSLSLFVGCSSNPIKKLLPVETKTQQGEIIVETEIPRTADRDDIPVGWEPDDVQAKITLKSGAKIYIPKGNKKPVAMNKQALEEIKSGDVKVERPKKSYAWLYWIIGIVFGLLVTDFAIRRFLGFNPIAWIFKRIFRK